ncbi:MAG: J domain-containing protein [Thermodesulfobacteriota bacterium]
MTNDQWKKLVAAKELLRLPDQATIAEVKQAYRKLSKQHHPDLAAGRAEQDQQQIEMHRLIEAYKLVMEYCKGYRIPLTPGQDQPLDGEAWWMDRFGCDPLWSPSAGRDLRKRR